jgi:hypothetical protein
MDIEDIEAGADYGELIDRMSRTVDSMIVLIGPQWLVAHDRAGNRRLDDVDDFVRQEISAALQRSVRVIPVLVQGAVMPDRADLPAPLAGLARRNAIELSDARWDYDAERLIRALESDLSRVETTGRAAGATASPKDAAEQRAPPFGDLTTLPASIAVSGLLAVLIWDVLVGRSWHDELGGNRIGAGVVLIVVAGLGLWRRNWRMVVAAGILGLLGFGIWMLQLFATGHDVEDLLSPSTDGIPNMLVVLGMVLVLVAGFVGMKQDSSRPVN